LAYFKNIVPCGIDTADRDVTSLSAELGLILDIDVVKMQVKKHLADVFQYEYL
jgi:lipoyl(octanoyl) transferase